MKRIFVMIMVVTVSALFTVSCSDDEDKKSSNQYTFVVNTTSSTAANYYSGQTLQLGFAGSTDAVSEAVVDENGKAVFLLPANLADYSSRDVWFGVKKVVKFFHTLTDAEISSATLILPDKDAGSIVKDKVNDWIVALYMGVNKGGKADGEPLYWATGNLITEKINEPGSSTKVVYRIADESESMEETQMQSSFMKVVKDYELIIDSDDAYVNMPNGTKWNMYQFGDNTGLRMYDIEHVEQFVTDTKQMAGSNIVYDISGNKDFDVATQLGGLWRIPTGGKTGNNEFAAFEDQVEEYANLKPNFAAYDDNGKGIKYDYVVTIDGNDICTNTLKFPFGGFRHSNYMFKGAGVVATYWTATADPTMTEIFNQPDMQREEYTVAFNFGYIQQLLTWFAHPRTSGMCVRPVTE